MVIHREKDIEGSVGLAKSLVLTYLLFCLNTFMCVLPT